MNSSISLQLYKEMVRIRIFEERLAEIVEDDRVRTPCHLYIGQEAVAAGICAALETQDTIWGCHRSHGHYLAKGGDMFGLMAEIFGKTTGCSRGRGGSMHVYDDRVGILGTVPLVAATIPLAAGAALSYRTLGEPHVAVAFFGDGATEEGHFHESLNIASLYRLPVIFVCENNLYASHLHIGERRAKNNIVESAEAHGMAGQCIDGNDVETVYAAGVEAVERARSGGGPTLLEARTFRWRGHVGPSWDMDVGVMRNDSLKEWLPKDPILRSRQALLAQGHPVNVLDEIVEEAKAEVEASVEFAERSPDPSPQSLLDHIFVPSPPPFRSMPSCP